MADFNTKLEFWHRRANMRINRTTKVRPAEAIWEDRRAMVPFPAGAARPAILAFNAFGSVVAAL